MKQEKTNNNIYIEAKKIEVDDFQRIKNKEKALLLRVNISAAVLSALAVGVLSSNGQNPFEIFAKLFAIPIATLVLSNIKILSIIKRKEKQEKLKNDYLARNNSGVGRRL